MRNKKPFEILLIDEQKISINSLGQTLLNELKQIKDFVHDNGIKVMTNIKFKGGNPILQSFNLILRGLKHGGTDMIFISPQEG